MDVAEAEKAFVVTTEKYLDGYWSSRDESKPIIKYRHQNLFLMARQDVACDDGYYSSGDETMNLMKTMNLMNIRNAITAIWQTKTLKDEASSSM